MPLNCDLIDIQICRTSVIKTKMREHPLTLDVRVQLSPGGRTELIRIPFTPQLARRKDLTEKHVLDLACKAKYPFGHRADISRWRKGMILVSPIESVQKDAQKVRDKFLRAKFIQALKEQNTAKYDAMNIASSGGGRFRY